MRTKFISAIVLVTILFSGCKNEKSVDDLKDVTPEVIDNTFKVVLDVIVKKDDNLQVYYNTGSGINEEQSVWSSVKGMEQSQKVEFKLPKDVIPEWVRIDLGVNDNQEDLILEGVEMEYKGKKFSPKGPELANFFYPLESTEIDFKTGTVKAKLKNGKRIEPALYSNEEAIKKEINKIIK